MLNGKTLVSKPEGNGANGVTPGVQAFADQLLNLPNVIEVAAAVHPVLLEVSCTAVNPNDLAMENEPQDLDTDADQGDSWFLVRVRIPTLHRTSGGLVSFIPQTVVGNGQNGSGQTLETEPA